MALVVLYVSRESAKNESLRFREFVNAVLSENIEQYSHTIQEEGKDVVEEEDELVDLDNVDEKILIRALNRENESQ